MSIGLFIFLEDSHSGILLLGWVSDCADLQLPSDYALVGAGACTSDQPSTEAMQIGTPTICLNVDVCLGRCGVWMIQGNADVGRHVGGEPLMVR